MNIYPYVYRVDHPSGEFYIGSRCANKVPAEADLGHKYKTSTKLLSHPFEEYTRTILAEFFTDTAKTDAYDFEQALIYEHWGNPGLVNRVCHYEKTRFSPAGRVVSAETKAKISKTKRGTRLSAETKAKISEAKQGRLHSEETKTKMSTVKRGQGRTHSEDTKAKISEANRGKTFSAEHRAKISEAGRRRHSANSRVSLRGQPPQASATA